MALLTEKPEKTKSTIPVMGKESKKKLNGEDKEALIALRAYYKAESRGYEPGHEIQDWLDAEAEVMAEAGSEKA